MAILGWVILVLASLYGSFVYALAAFNGLGRYNIGGVPNLWRNKVMLIAAGIGLVLWWFSVASWAPFSIVAKSV